MKTLLTILFFLVTIFTNAKVLIPAKLNGKYGFIDTSGNWMIHPTFDSVEFFCNGYARYHSRNKDGLIDSNGNIVLSAVWDFAGKNEEGISMVVRKGAVRYINLLTGKQIGSKYKNGEDFSNGMACVTGKNNKSGYINKEGRLVIPFIYEIAYDFKNDSAIVMMDDDYHYIDKTGRDLGKVNDIVYLREPFNIIRGKDGKLGRENSRGEIIMEPIYDYFGYVHSGLSWFKLGGKYGIVDTNGKIIVPAIYEYLRDFSEGLAEAKLDGKWGFISRTGEVVIPMSFEESSVFKFNRAAVKLNGKWGFIDRTGNWKIKPIFENTGDSFRIISTSCHPSFSFDP